MNIIHLRSSNFYGGPERQLHLHALRAKESGYNVTIASFSEGGKTPEFLDIISKDNIRTYLFVVKNAYDIKAIKILRQYVRDNDIRILCTHDYRSCIIAFWAIRGCNARWIAFSRGWTKDTLRVRIYGFLDRVFIRFADRIVAVSASQRQKLMKVMVPSDKIDVVPNAVATDISDKIRKVDLKAKFGFSDNSIMVVSAGRFSREKGQIILVKAAADAVRINDLLRFVLFGDGPDLGRIKRIITKLKLESKIICPGFEPNLLEYLKGADILVNSSLSEGMPNIVLEAMALGVPVIATAVGGVPGLIVSEVSGLLIPAGDVLKLSQAVLKLAGDSEKRNRFAAAAYQTVTDSFSFEKQMEALGQIYKGVAAGR